MGKDRAEIEIDAAALETQRQYREKIKEILQNQQSPKRALVHTYGCQQNVSDSERIKGMLGEMGYEITESQEEADLILFNTCAVREHAEQRVFGNVGALKNLKAQKPSLIIGLCGCMMQEEHVAKKIKTVFPFVNLVFGTHVIHKLPELLYSVMERGGRVFDIEDSDGVIAEGLPVRRDGTIKAWLPIMYGCNNFCSYCIVPYVRGRERSRDPETVLEEARSLIGEGFKEITLLGQNVNSYGKDLDGGRKINFAKLLREINAIDGDFRIRFMTSHPKDATRELIDAIAECDKICKHIHLPFQAGSDRILRLMNRVYNRESYLELTRYAKEKIPGLSLTTDIIIGFPGETYEEFLETVDVVRQVEFDNIFTFIYSKRKGTPAEQIPDPVTHEEKAKWFGQLLEVQGRITQRRFEALVGSTFRVLCEGRSKSESEPLLTGRTDGNLIVDFPGSEDLTGRFVQVKITRARKFMLVGELSPEQDLCSKND